MSVSFPAPPSKVIAIPADASDESIVKLSSPLPPLTERLAHGRKRLRVARAVDRHDEIRAVDDRRDRVCCTVRSRDCPRGGRREATRRVRGRVGSRPAVVPVRLDAPSDCVVGVVPPVAPVVLLDDVPVPAVVPLDALRRGGIAGLSRCVAADDVCVWAVAVTTAPEAEPAAVLLSIVPGSPVLLEICGWVVAAAVDASTVPVSLLPMVAVTCGAGAGACCEEVSAGACEDVSAGAGELVVSGVLASFTENHPIPVSAAVVAAGCVAGGAGSAGAAVGSVGAPVVSVGGVAGGAAGTAVAAAVAGSATGVPTLSLTTGAFANGSFGVAVLLFAGGGPASARPTPPGRGASRYRRDVHPLRRVAACACEARLLRAEAAVQLCALPASCTRGSRQPERKAWGAQLPVRGAKAVGTQRGWDRHRGSRARPRRGRPTSNAPPLNATRPDPYG